MEFASGAPVDPVFIVHGTTPAEEGIGVRSDDVGLDDAGCEAEVIVLR